jgi:hypothetical protein
MLSDAKSIQPVTTYSPEQFKHLEEYSNQSEFVSSISAVMDELKKINKIDTDKQEIIEDLLPEETMQAESDYHPPPSPSSRVVTPPTMAVLIVGQARSYELLKQHWTKVFSYLHNHGTFQGRVRYFFFMNEEYETILKIKNFIQDCVTSKPIALSGAVDTYRAEEHIRQFREIIDSIKTNPLYSNFVRSYTLDVPKTSVARREIPNVDNVLEQQHQFYQLQQALMLMQKYETSHKMEFSHVLKLRMVILAAAQAAGSDNERSSDNIMLAKLALIACERSSDNIGTLCKAQSAKYAKN